MKKFLILLFLTPLVLAVGFLGTRYLKNPKQIAPYPYLFSQKVTKIGSLKSPILIVGDRMGAKLADYSYVLEQRLSEGRRSKVKIESWAKDGEGLHRTLQKLKSLEQLPKVIIYMGGSQEWYEKKFFLDHINTINKNFDIYQDSLVRSLFMFVPQTAPFIYHPHPRVELSAKILRQQGLKHPSIQKKNQLLYRLYELELTEFIEYIQNNASLPIIINTPLNRDIAPKKVCHHTLNQKAQQIMKEIYLELKEGKAKLVLPRAQNLKTLAPGNAMVHYITGLAYKELDRTKEAVKELHMAMSFDCGQWRGGPIYNIIQKQVSSKKELYYVDFDELIHQSWPKNALFYDDVHPQNLYYEKAMEQVAQVIKEALGL